MCSWSSKRMANPKVQNLRKDLNDCTLPTYFLYILQEQWLIAQVLIFVLNSLRDTKLVEVPRIYGQGKKDCLNLDNHYDLVFFLMYNCFLKVNSTTKRQLLKTQNLSSEAQVRKVIFHSQDAQVFVF